MTTDDLGALLDDFKRAYEHGDAPDPLDFAAAAPDEHYELVLERLEDYLDTAPLIRPGSQALARGIGRQLLLGARAERGDLRRALAGRALTYALQADDTWSVSEARGLLEPDPVRALLVRWKHAVADGPSAARALAFGLLADGGCRLEVVGEATRGGPRTFRFAQGGTAQLGDDGTLRISYVGAVSGQPLLVLPAAIRPDAPAVEWSADTLVPGLTQAHNAGGRITATVGRLPDAADRAGQVVRLLEDALLKFV